MFEPHVERLQQFDDNDFAFMVQLTACHPYLLQVGCKILLDDRLSGKKRKAEDEELLTKYLEYTEDLYWSYWNNLIDDKERGWLRDCFWVLSLEDKKTYLKELQTDTLHRKNAAIYKRLVSLGLVVSKEDSLEIPRGFAAFYETNLAENR